MALVEVKHSFLKTFFSRDPMLDIYKDRIESKLKEDGLAPNADGVPGWRVTYVTRGQKTHLYVGFFDYDAETKKAMEAENG